MNKEITPIRTVFIKEPWWVVKDVCTAFGIVNHKDAINALRKNYELIGVDIKGVVSTYPLQTAGGVQNVTIIRDAGVYALAFQSRKKEALRFQHWVTSEVLPSIRKTGGYVQP